MRWYAVLLVALATPATATPVTLPARAVRYRAEAHGWARVEPLAPLVVRTMIAARVTRMLVTPGQVVSAGAPLVTLGGPQLDSELAAARARARAARHELAAAQRTKDSVARTYPVVTNRQALDAAQAALAAAKSKQAAANAALAGLQSQRTLRSPMSATVSEVDAAPGADVAADAPVLTLLPQGSLWLRVEVFADQPVPEPGTARFVPADGGPAIPVHRVAALPARAPDGARVFNFAARSPAPWQAGETGELVWPGTPQSAVAVPSDALVLNAGHWYVLVDDHGNLVAHAVTLGPTRGADVLITHGLQAGTPVVVRQAYLLFHRNFSAQYAPSD